MSFKACVSLLIFCLDDLSIDVSVVLNEVSPHTGQNGYHQKVYK